MERSLRRRPDHSALDEVPTPPRIDSNKSETRRRCTRIDSQDHGGHVLAGEDTAGVGQPTKGPEPERLRLCLRSNTPAVRRRDRLERP